jgi:ankyrin repeat protein
MLAALGGHHEVIALLAEAGVRVDSKNPEGNTALMLAAQAGNKAAVEGLLAAGADPTLVNRKRKQAAKLASAAGHSDIAALLNERGGTGLWLLKGF